MLVERRTSPAPRTASSMYSLRLPFWVQMKWCERGVHMGPRPREMTHLACRVVAAVVTSGTRAEGMPRGFPPVAFTR